MSPRFPRSHLGSLDDFWSISLLAYNGSEIELAELFDQVLEGLEVVWVHVI
jgi:hypothetical protein